LGQLKSDPSISNNNPEASKTESNASTKDMGSTRADPIPKGTMVSVPGWQIFVLEFLRGEEARKIIDIGDSTEESLDADWEYALAKVSIRCTAQDNKAHDLGISEMFMSGDRNLSYGDSMDGWPQPEFLFEDMYSAEIVEGWVDAVIPKNEQNMILVVDVDQYENRTTRFFELEDDAAIQLSNELVNLESNQVGLAPDTAASPGQTVITPDWEFTILESLTGKDAETLLQKDNIYYAPPEDGFGYLVLKFQLVYKNKNDIPFWVGYDTFYALDENGYMVEGAMIYNPPGLDWINTNVLPGADLTSWVSMYTKNNIPSPIIVFDPDRYNYEGQNVNIRYLKIN
jgi:hypothetical protein